MLAEQMLEMILAERRREMEAAARARLVTAAASRDAGDAALSASGFRVGSGGIGRPGKHQARTATDPSA